MDGFTLKKDINVTTITTFIVAVAAFYFGTKGALAANAQAAADNKAAIELIEEKTDNIDVIEFKVDMNARALARIEAKLDE